VVRRQRPGCPGRPQLRPDHERLTGAAWRARRCGRFPPRFAETCRADGFT
jgi:hypothetical protein